MFPLYIRPEADLSSSDCNYFDILIVLADFLSWHLIQMLKVSGINTTEKNIAALQSFYPNIFPGQKNNNYLQEK